MNPNSSPSTSPAAAFYSFKNNRELILQMTKREVLSRYKGSSLGVLWSFATPALTLLIYTFVFSRVFKTKWAAGNESETQFAIVLFVGLIVYNLFADVITQSPTLIVTNVNFVKKVVFPLEILAMINLGVATFHAAVGSLALLIAIIMFYGTPSATCILYPLVVAPLLMVALGISWILSSLGVYLRDIKQAVNIATSMLLFISPVFYPVEALPSNFQTWMKVNPLTFVIEQSRRILIWGDFPDWRGLIFYYVGAILVMWVGWIWFQKTRKGFSDVL